MKKLYKFWAAWCGPCRIMKPVVEKVVSERSDVELFEVDVDTEDGACMVDEYNVSSVPTFILEDEAGERKTKIGACTEQALIDFIDGK